MRVPKSITYIAGFAAARGSLFFAPIVLANLISTELYGTLELAQATAAILAMFIGCGMQATVPLILLRPEVTARWDTLLWLLSRLAGLCCIVSLAAWIYTKDFASFPVILGFATGALLLQGLWAATLKSSEKGTAAVFLEAGFWAAALGGAFVIFIGSGATWAISAAIAVYALILLAVTVRQHLAKAKPFKRTDLKANVSLGVPLMFTTLLTIMVSSSGRLILGGVSGVEAVGIYAILYRAATLPLVGHQLLIIAMFKKLFVWEIGVLQRRAPIIVFGVSASIVGFWIVAGPFGWMLGEKFDETFKRFPFEGHLILLQTVLWSAIALNDLLVSRLQVAGPVARTTALYLLIALPALTWATYNKGAGAPTADVMGYFVAGYAALMIGYYLVQCFAISRQGHVFARLWISTLVCFSLGLIVLFLQEYMA